MIAFLTHELERQRAANARGFDRAEAIEELLELCGSLARDRGVGDLTAVEVWGSPEDEQWTGPGRKFARPHDRKGRFPVRCEHCGSSYELERVDVEAVAGPGRSVVVLCR